MDVDQFGKDSGFLPPLPSFSSSPLLLEGDMASSGLDEEVGELFLCWFLPLLRNLSFLLFIFPQVVDQSLHHLRTDGELLVLGKDCSPRFLGGELCGPFKDQGFQEGINPFLLPEASLVIEEVQVFPGILYVTSPKRVRMVFLVFWSLSSNPWKSILFSRKWGENSRILWNPDIHGTSLPECF